MAFGFERGYSRERSEKAERLVSDIERAIHRVEVTKNEKPDELVLCPGDLPGQLPYFASKDKVLQIMHRDLEKAKAKRDNLQGMAKDEAEGLNERYDALKLGLKDFEEKKLGMSRDESSEQSDKVA